MTAIRIVTATHFDQPGVKVSAHRSMQGARNRAIELVKALLAAARLDFDVTERSWIRAVSYLRTCGRECDVEITTVELEP